MKDDYGGKTYLQYSTKSQQVYTQTDCWKTFQQDQAGVQAVLSRHTEQVWLYNYKKAIDMASMTCFHSMENKIWMLSYERFQYISVTNFAKTN